MAGLLLHLLFALGGGLGAVLRYVLTSRLTHRYPVSTLLVNVLGCFLLGWSLTVLWEAPGLLGDQERRLFAGFCGGFTTFSTFAYQSFDLHRRYSVIHAALNIGANLLLCIGAFLLGRWGGTVLH
ncbi:MAG: CrcB family protein [Xanthomonadales bacterium]|jgi:CrcB protein|nr:CrcB family protein [Xanthomonadales bacterium]